MPKVLVNDITLYYEWHGNPAGPVVVFVNGLLTDTSSWTRHLPAFTDGYHCLVYDCRGQGQSDKPDAVYATAQHSADLAALVLALQIDSAHLVGLSNGGAACLGYAAEAGTRVRSLSVAGAYATVDTILRAKLLSWIRAMEAGGSPLRFDVALPWVWGGAFLEANYDSLQGFREKGVNLAVGPARNLIAGAMVHDCRTVLPAIAAPTLVVVGDEDLLTPPKLAQEIATGVQQGTLTVMAGCGHAAALEDVAGFCALVRAFMDRY
ncbi:MAG TPA: alpha/beta fold hydrolase [Chloroflexia bacterium]|nr:alpha/beta fold hydrolase [Chloroflexia bacterium]